MRKHNVLSLYQLKCILPLNKNTHIIITKTKTNLMLTKTILDQNIY